MSLTTSFSITGKITSLSGTGLAGVVINYVTIKQNTGPINTNANGDYVLPPIGYLGKDSKAVTTDSNGQYSIPNLGNGTYLLSAINNQPGTDKVTGIRGVLAFSPNPVNVTINARNAIQNFATINSVVASV